MPGSRDGGSPCEGRARACRARRAWCSARLPGRASGGRWRRRVLAAAGLDRYQAASGPDRYRPGVRGRLRPLQRRVRGARPEILTRTSVARRAKTRHAAGGAAWYRSSSAAARARCFQRPPDARPGRRAEHQARRARQARARPSQAAPPVRLPGTKTQATGAEVTTGTRCRRKCRVTANCHSGRCGRPWR